jgi:UDP-2,3-diacylglucosamine hydrolase
MSVAVVADAHIGGPGGPAGPLVEQLRELPAAGCRHLLLIGDLFHVWVGFRKYETDDIRRVVETLIELRRGGMRIDYIEGNRDFFIGDGYYADAFDQVADEMRLEIGETRVLAVHGDGIDRSDRQYLFWRRLSKNRLSRLAMKHLPGALARKILDGTERRLAETNFAHKVEIPRQAICDWAEGRLAEGYDLLILGHYHEPFSWRVRGGEVRLLDAWFNSRRVEWLEPVADSAGGDPGG